MPKVIYSAAKGLFQEEGSGLRLAGDMQGHRWARKSITSTASLDASNSGMIITLTGTAFTLTLPGVSASAGCHFHIVAGAAENYVISEDTGTDTDVLTMVSVNATATERDHAFTTATLSAGAIGDRFEIYSNGTWWVITAFANAAVAAA